jgi:tetratricopeptide (TPR) repeat protein
MSVSEKRWVVKDRRGRIYGPFNSAKVIHYIQRGNFSGEEKIAEFPNGVWRSLSKIPQFYDALLLSIAPNSNAANPSDLAEFEIKGSMEGGESFSVNDSGKAVPVGDEPLRSTPANSNDEFVSPIDPIALTPEPQSAPQTTAVSPRVRRINTAQPKSDVIELADVGEILKKARFQGGRRPVIAVAAVVAVVAMAMIFLPSKNPTMSAGKVKLLTPRKGQPTMEMDQVKKRYAKALAGFQKDSFDGFVTAQNELIQIVEGAPRVTEPFALLCLTQKELWPYTSQSSQELAAAKSVAQQGFQIDIAGYNGQICRITDMMISGRYIEAFNAAEEGTAAFTMALVLNQLKAELLVAQRKFERAIENTRAARTNWPQWLKPYVTEALALAETDRYGEADQLLRKVLQDNPNHAQAKVELALLQLKYFRDYDKALEYLQAAIHSSVKMPPSLEAKAYWALARTFAARKENDKALDAARTCYKLSGVNVECRNMVVQLGGKDSLKEIKVENREALYLGDQYAKAGDCFAAQAEYKAAYEADNKNGLAALKAAKCLWKLHYSAEALLWLEKSIQADTNLVDAHVALADFNAQRYNYETAYRTLGQISKRFPKDYRVFLGYGQVEYRRRNFKAAITYLERARQLHPGEVETYILLAESNLGLGKYAEALEQATKAMEMDNGHIPGITTYGKALAMARSPNDGISFLQEQINTYPLINEYRTALAEVYLMDEKFEKARDVYRSVVESGFEDKKVFMALAEVEQTLGSPKNAIKLLLRAAALDPTDPEPFFKVGVVHFTLDDDFQAKQYLTKALQANPLYPSAHYYLGRLSLRRGAIQEALLESAKERKINPNLADAYLLAAEAYAKSGLYRECAGEYQKAIKLRPQGSEIYVKIAQCYRQGGSLEVALSMLKIAADKESGNPNIYKEQVAIYAMKGDSAAAAEAFDKFRALVPNAPPGEIAEMERELASIKGQ